MLAARGVSLGLGKINLSELNQIPAPDRATLSRITRARKKRESMQPRFTVKKRVDRQTLFAACKAVIFGAIFIASGFAMTVFGYFDKELATQIIFNSTIQAEMNQLDNTKRLFFKAMQYVGPILMGFGAICLIVACVMTLESRDKHAEIIQDESIEFRKTKIERETTKTSLLSPLEEEIENSTIEITSKLSGKTPTPVFAITSASSPQKFNVHKFLNINVRKPKGPAPIAQADSIFDLRSISPQFDESR